MFSEIALIIYTLKKEGKIKTNFQFWKNFYYEKVLNSIEIDRNIYQIELNNSSFDIICAFDKEFPNVKEIKRSERPYLFAYKGNIKLLKETNKNIAVIGVLTPTKDIEERENIVVKKLTDGKHNIVSGLALGCDTIAHKSCIENFGKTIAILPTTFENIYPKENRELVNKIVESGGLVITEYITEPENRFEEIKRFIERDRLQAMFSSSVILIASFRKGEGDSGSRHAMEKAKELNRKRFVMFNKNLDMNKKIFGLNEDLIKDGVCVLTEKSMKEILS